MKSAASLIQQLQQVKIFAVWVLHLLTWKLTLPWAMK
jgi:hypothetical protein